MSIQVPEQPEGQERVGVVMSIRNSVSTTKLAEESTYVKFIVILDEMIYEGYYHL